MEAWKQQLAELRESLSGEQNKSRNVLVYENVNELCRELRVTPEMQEVKVTWVIVLDESTGIISSNSKEHPWVFFRSNLDADQSGFSRSRNPKGQAGLPRRIGHRSHAKNLDCLGSCGFLDEDAWIDFDSCAPPEQFKQQLAPYKGVSEVITTLAKQPRAKMCERESKDMSNQLWIAFKTFRDGR